MGTPIFAVPILKSLYQNGYPISAVYTQPPQKSHRGQKINKSPIQGISETLNIDFRCPQNLKDNIEEYEYLKKNKCRPCNSCCIWSNYSKKIFKFNKKRIHKYTCIFTS